MDFELTEEMRMLKEMAYKFAAAEIAPVSAQCDEQEKYLPEIRKKAAENGLVGAWIPEAYGGSGAGILGNAIITEELSKIDMGIGLNIVAPALAASPSSTTERKSRKKPICRRSARAFKCAPGPTPNPMRERMSRATRRGPSRTEPTT